jgi:ATP-dependent Clp endopeptidase proteolytic subunit ClpP
LVRKHNYGARGSAELRGAYPMAARIRAEAGTTRVDIFDDVGSDGWGGGLSAADFAAKLAGVKGPLTVGINSAGGDVFDGLAIYNAVNSYAGPVTTVVDGLAASIASVIMQAGQARVVSPGGMVMVHDAFGACLGNEAEMTAMAKTLAKVSDNLASVYAKRCGGTAQQWRQVMRAESWYTADEALAAGLADRVGTGTAVLPAGLDLAAYSAVPRRIAARLRSMPRAAAPSGNDSSVCKTCRGWGRLKHPATGKAGRKCPSCGGSGTYSPDGSGAQGRRVDDATAREMVRQLRTALPPLTGRYRQEAR